VGGVAVVWLVAAIAGQRIEVIADGAEPEAQKKTLFPIDIGEVAVVVAATTVDVIKVVGYTLVHRSS